MRSSEKKSWIVRRSAYLRISSYDFYFISVLSIPTYSRRDQFIQRMSKQWKRRELTWVGMIRNFVRATYGLIRQKREEKSRPKMSKTKVNHQWIVFDVWKLCLQNNNENDFVRDFHFLYVWIVVHVILFHSLFAFTVQCWQSRKKSSKSCISRHICRVRVRRKLYCHLCARGVKCEVYIQRTHRQWREAMRRAQKLKRTQWKSLLARLVIAAVIRPKNARRRCENFKMFLSVLLLVCCLTFCSVTNKQKTSAEDIKFQAIQNQIIEFTLAHIKWHKAHQIIVFAFVSNVENENITNSSSSSRFRERITKYQKRQAPLSLEE